MKSIKLRANAKLNLFLDITGKQANGYHTLKTVMQSADLCDELEFIISDGTGIEIFCNRSDLPLNEDNLVWKGISAVLSYAYFSPGCKITVNLTKNIPSGAGLGGGSADCAAAIIAMNELFHLDFFDDELKTVAAMCGADVPFCIKGGTALCEGVGDIITPLPTLAATDIVIAKPKESISTPEAYALFDKSGRQSEGDYAAFEAAMTSGSAKELGGALYNAFTESCAPMEVKGIRNKLKMAGALGAEMTGSGSAVYGIFADGESAQAALKKFECCDTFAGAYRTAAKGVEMIK